MRIQYCLSSTASMFSFMSVSGRRTLLGYFQIQICMKFASLFFACNEFIYCFFFSFLFFSFFSGNCGTDIVFLINLSVKYIKKLWNTCLGTLPLNAFYTGNAFSCSQAASQSTVQQQPPVARKSVKMLIQIQDIQESIYFY